MSAAKPALTLLSPEVIDVSSVRRPVEKPHLNWLVGYAPERDEDDLGRIVFGTIHAGASNGFAEVTVACLMGYPAEAEPGTEKFKKLLKKSDALEALYDVARIAFRSTAAITDIGVELPRKAPDPEMNELVRASDDSQAEEAAPESN
ncbi:hypothetical protein RL72_01138 [Microbacterium azadirachtae]|uniref:Uncharacterized protein n=1 Tax=Microbacterium azadirachtae TaxID=582680 RepID=A0A0F0KZB0_9MICO|nr:hypothetical protein [Microbacterium azadirachtae]KJL26203.1 hypothetical protein RL72_01138 [Microbacterium azadirachtae]